MNGQYADRIPLTDILREPDRFIGTGGMDPDATAYGGDSKRMVIYKDGKVVASNEYDKLKALETAGIKAAQMSIFSYRMLSILFHNPGKALSSKDLTRRITGNSRTNYGLPENELSLMEESILGDNALVNKDKDGKYTLRNLEGYEVEIGVITYDPQSQKIKEGVSSLMGVNFD